MPDATIPAISFDVAKKLPVDLDSAIPTFDNTLMHDGYFCQVNGSFRHMTIDTYNALRKTPPPPLAA